MEMPPKVFSWRMFMPPIAIGNKFLTFNIKIHYFYFSLIQSAYKASEKDRQTRKPEKAKE